MASENTWKILCDRHRHMISNRTSLTMDSLVLQHKPANASLVLQPAHAGQEESIAALADTKQHTANPLEWLICTALQRPLDPSCQPVAVHMLAVLRYGHLMGLLRTVTRLDLYGMDFAAPLLPAISNSLPNLTTYNLLSSTLNWGQATADSFTGSFSNLRHLGMLGISNVGPRKAWQQHLDQQIARLTTLTDLTLNNCEITDAILSFAPQLTYLAMLSYHTLCPGYSLDDLAAHLTSLQELRLPALILEDVGMPPLLGLPSLQRLEVAAFNLHRSWAGQQCRWQELVCDILSTQDLACLPLHSTLVLKACNPTLNPQVVLGMGTLDSINAAVTAVARSRLPSWHSLWLIDQEPQCGLVHIRFVQALPLLVTARDLCIYVQGLSISTLLVYLQNPAVQQHPICLRLPAPCAGTVTEIAELISHMPAGSELVLGWLRAREELLAELCRAARQGIKVLVGVGQLSAGCEERIQAALLEKDHISVQLQRWNAADGGQFVIVQCSA